LATLCSVVFAKTVTNRRAEEHTYGQYSSKTAGSTLRDRSMFAVQRRILSPSQVGEPATVDPPVTFAQRSYLIHLLLLLLFL